MKAKIINHNISDKTGMLHLCDRDFHSGESEGKNRRIKDFPINTIVEVKKAHLCDGVQVYIAYNNDKLDYFSEDELSFDIGKDDKFEISQIVKMIMFDLSQRDKKGQEEYGKSMDRNDLSLLEWLQHSYEEQLDNLQYTKKAIEILKKGEMVINPVVKGKDLVSAWERYISNEQRGDDK